MAEPSDKTQFNVYLPRDLVRAVKHAAVDADRSLSVFVQTALEEFLARQAGPHSKETP